MCPFHVLIFYILFNVVWGPRELRALKNLRVNSPLWWIMWRWVFLYFGFTSICSSVVGLPDPCWIFHGFVPLFLRWSRCCSRGNRLWNSSGSRISASNIHQKCGWNRTSMGSSETRKDIQHLQTFWLELWNKQRSYWFWEKKSKI